MNVVSSILDSAVLLVFLVAAAVCLAKGRRVPALLGLISFGAGAAASFPIFRLVREGLADDWIWVTLAVQGAALAALVVWVAILPARPGSWWDRRDRQSA